MRHEFSKQTKRAALERSGGFCEAIGSWYGLQDGQRCNVPLGKGVQFDHIHSAENGGDNSLENCCACCVSCHAQKTAKVDIPRAAKTKRMSDKAKGIKKSSRPMPGSKTSKFKRKMNGRVELR